MEFQYSESLNNHVRWIKKARIWVIFENFENILILSARAGDKFKDKMVQKTMPFETTHVTSRKHVKMFLLSSKKYITFNVLPTENAPYPTANRDAEHPNTPRVLVN